MATKPYLLPAGSGPEQLVLFSGSVAGTTGDWEPVTLVDSTGKEVLPTLVGTYDYDGGTAKAITPPNGARVLTYAAHATGGGASVQVTGKALIPIIAQTGFAEAPNGSMVMDGVKTITFIGTDSCFCSWVL